MKILDNTKSLSTLVSDTSNGLGQIQPLTCTVTEELNGIYELDFTVNVNDRHYADLKNSGLVKVTVGDGSEQIFRIYKIDEPINMISSVHCQHITYDLSKVVVKPFTATGAVNIKNQLVSNMLVSYPFSTPCGDFLAQSYLRLKNQRSQLLTAMPNVSVLRCRMDCVPTLL